MTPPDRDDDETRNLPEDQPQDQPQDGPQDSPGHPYDPQAGSHGAPPAYPPPHQPYGQGYGQPYGQGHYGQRQYGHEEGQYGEHPYPPAQGQYGGQYGQQGQYGYGTPQPGYGYAGGGTPPAHPSASTSMVLGIVGLAGIMFCGGITLVVSPFAWAMGRKAVNEIDANPGAYSGRDQARGGQIMGIIGTVLLVIGILGLILLLGLFATAVDTDSMTFETS